MRLSEVILHVEDMQKQVEFYRDTLGLDVIKPPGLADYSGESWVELDTGECRLCLHAGGKRQFGQDAPRIVFEWEAIEAAHDALLDMGVDLGALRSPTPGVTVCDGKDPEGNVFSLERKS